ncbi:MAG: chemotaxis protein CheR [Sphingobacteriia bacterium]|nr:chemotaxis protein CheR [Sphingobacteriia bacterium]NCC38284.1 chemotaxis protein CheR [Gammaproteobacteria bacterium]
MAAAESSHGPRPIGRFTGPVVALGASAGGLDALERFFAGVPADSGAAYVVIQHLSPDHKSMMASLLARHTSMPVSTVADAMRIEPNRVYLIPPASLMSVAGECLRLRPKRPRGLNLPIDLFFSSLAQEVGSRAIGVVLSGTGSDGTRGAVAINDAGGVLLAQDPDTAHFDGMPRSVIATGLVDAILPPEALAPWIVEHIRQAPSCQTDGATRVDVMAPEDAFEEILHLLQRQGGPNFREYKEVTLMRRIERRMQVRHVPDLTRYVPLLANDPGELALLRREILIPVTSFFRDPEAFEILGDTAIKTILAERTDGQPLRVWVAGSSTGEEAYSLAMLLTESCDRARRWPSFKLFATDVEQQHVDLASAGVFTEAITAELSPARLERFFERRGHHFVVKGALRQHIVFARHDLLVDPPFTRMNLISCRNLLIYLNVSAQERVLRRIQYALAPGGFLFLGSSESLGNRQADFTLLSSKHKIYRLLRSLALPLDPRAGRHAVPVASGVSPNVAPRARMPNSDAAVIDAGQALLVRSYAPSSLLLNQRLELLHVFGDVGAYLRIAEGSATLDIAKLLTQPLVAVAQALLHKSARSGSALRSEIIRLDPSARGQPGVRLVVRPLELGEDETHLLLSFEPQETMPLGGSMNPPHLLHGLDLERETALRIESLERELGATRESLQATIEELETTNEELQATNEELMASNEELQSANEELQSVNEELYTLNAESQEKIEILNRLNVDLENLAKAAEIATIFVDADLNLTRFTPEATSLFKVREGDLGRPLDDLTNLLRYPRFLEELRLAIGRGEMLQRQIQAANGRVYLSRLLPYAIGSDARRGAVATFIDISTLQESAERITDVGEAPRAESFVRSSSETSAQ